MTVQTKKRNESVRCTRCKDWGAVMDPGLQSYELVPCPECRSTGNVFADLGLQHADELKALSGMKMRGLFPDISWRQLCVLLTGKSTEAAQTE